jgi:hypothetical protein
MRSSALSYCHFIATIKVVFVRIPSPSFAYSPREIDFLLESAAVFKTGAINRSTIPPGGNANLAAAGPSTGTGASGAHYVIECGTVNGSSGWYFSHLDSPIGW